MAPAAIGRIVARYAHAADLPAALRTAHVLRHTFCTAIAERAGLDIVAELAGHADVRTSKRYVTATRTRDAVDAAFGAGTFARRLGRALTLAAARSVQADRRSAARPAAASAAARSA